MQLTQKVMEEIWDPLRFTRWCPETSPFCIIFGFN